MFVRNCIFEGNAYVSKKEYLQGLNVRVKFKERIFREYSKKSKHLDNTGRGSCVNSLASLHLFYYPGFICNVENC